MRAAAGAGRGGEPGTCAVLDASAIGPRCGGYVWGLGREEADAEPARDRKPLPSRWSRSILACARVDRVGRVGGVSAEF